MENEKKECLLSNLDSDQLFWFLLIKWCLILIAVFVVSVIGCTVEKRSSMVKLVELGVSSILAHCSIYKGDLENDSICILEISKTR